MSNEWGEELLDWIDTVLQEDIREGDHTTLATIPPDAHGQARLLVKESGIVAGVDLARIILQHVNPETEVNISIPDGARVEPGDIILTAYGRTQALLVAERTLLNVMQRLSGIATKTNLYVQQVRHTKARILDTRKTTPGFRRFEKWAVRTGGGHNHRHGLYDMIMIKDNHVDFCGSITKAVERVRQYQEEQGLSLAVEVETRNLDEVKEALFAGGVQRIMLDNFNLEGLREAVQLIRGRVEVEASGGVRLDTVRAIAETGVDFISVGELTHSVQSLDLSFKAFR